MPTFITPVLVDPTADGTFNDIDISANVGSDAGNIALAMLQVINTHATTQKKHAIRKNGSTDDRYFDMEDKGHTWHHIGVDGNDIFELKAETDDVEIWLMGYWTLDEAANITNGVDKSLGSVNSFIDIDITADVVSGVAVAAMLQVIDNNTVSTRYLFRENGSTDDVGVKRILSNDMHGAWISLDSNEIFEAEINNTSIDFYLIGYALSNFTSFTNSIQHSTGTTGSYQTTDLGGTIPAGKNGAALRANATDDQEYSWAVRPLGSSFDEYHDISNHAFHFSEIDGDRKIEQKIETTSLDLFIWGYTVLSPVPATLVVLRRRRANSGMYM